MVVWTIKDVLSGIKHFIYINSVENVSVYQLNGTSSFIKSNQGLNFEFI
jgi:hypothetical protein